MLTGNKGEWSEVYALLKLVGDKKVFAGDKKLEKINDLAYPIIQIIRNEKTDSITFSYDDNSNVIIKTLSDTQKIPIDKFTEKSKKLLLEILAAKESAFSVPDIEEFLISFGCSKLKAKSSKKSDINIVIHDERTGAAPNLGFSIKSQLGSPSTLFNPGATTNFIYEILGAKLSKQDISRINSESKFKEKIKYISKKGCSLKYVDNENKTLYNNLLLIDSALPSILAQMLLLHYSGEGNDAFSLTKLLTKINPEKYSGSAGQPFYEYKIKHFLTDVALGMTPAKVWTGQYDATGGYLIVKKDGDIICCHSYNKNEFEDYLFHNTRLDTPSSSRYKFGTVYEEAGKQYIKLNLQIRFK